MTHAVKHVVFVSWDDVEQLVSSVARQLRDQRRFDVLLGIGRGGLIPTALLAQRLGAVNIGTIAVQNNDPRGLPLPEPLILQFPQRDVLSGQRVLVVDDVIRTGQTMDMVVRRLRSEGATVHVAVLHLKPTIIRRNGRPTTFGEVTDLDPIYPWSREAKIVI